VEVKSQSITDLDDVLRRVSFGRNGGKTSGSSTAVAVGIILNYLDRTVDNRILPDNLKAEDLKGSEYNKVLYMRTSWLHHYLLKTCQLEPGRFGRWGKGVVDRFRRFWQLRPFTQGVIVRCRFGGYDDKNAWRLIKKEIDLSRPAMVTLRKSKLAGGKPCWHTVVVCGYRITPFGKRELLIHAGMYGDSIKGSRVQLKYVPLKDVVCSYRFDVLLLAAARKR
jgi:hypothetical protein